MPLALFLKTCCLGNCTGISFIDSTPIRVCKNKRIKRNKVFKGIANTGKSTMGWFDGFKLHIIINDKGEILNFTITQASDDDRAPLKQERFLDKILGKLFADKGYIGKDLAQLLFVDGIQLITQIKNNMKNCLMTIYGFCEFCISIILSFFFYQFQETKIIIWLGDVTILTHCNK